MGVSLNPKDQVKGGLIDDVDAVATNFRFETREYDDGSGVVLTCDFTPAGDSEPMSQSPWWSVGSAAEWNIDADGFSITSTSRSPKSGTVDSSNFSMFMRELEPAGFPTGKIVDKINVLDDVTAHWVRKAQPTRGGMSNTNARGQEKTTLVMEKILSHPLINGGKGVAKNGSGTRRAAGTSASAAKPAPPAAAKPVSAAPASDPAADLENEAALEIAMEVAQTMIANYPGKSYTKNSWGVSHLSTASSTANYKQAAQDVKNAVRRLLTYADFLSSQGIELSATGEVVLPAAASE
jgi:hypothetical protein